MEPCTTEEVVERVIKADTAAQCCAYVDLPGVATAPPQHFVSHAWSRPFKELVQCLKWRFSGREDAVVWLDIFAFNQHVDTDVMAENLATLEATVRETVSTLAILDGSGTCFTRIWCLLEQFTAVTAGGLLDGSTGKLEILAYLLDSLGGAVSKVLSSIDVRAAGARYAADRDRILGQISDTYGAEKFNATLRTGLAVAVAEPLYSKAIAVYRRSLGADHPRTARVQFALAELCIAKRHFEKAEGLLRATLTVRRTKLGDYHPDTSRTLMRLAQLLHHLGDHTAAADAYAAARESFCETLGPDHRRTAAAAEGLATVIYLMANDHAPGSETHGGLSRAADLLLYALEVYRKRFGDGHPATARTHELLDRCLLRRLGVEIPDAAEGLAPPMVRGGSPPAPAAHFSSRSTLRA
uniref:Atp-dependent transcriptional regulator n=1 Tax=Tetraselmis sp. GSL018 TaxID=582737 RepID=A0A061RJK0_9CHLO